MKFDVKASLHTISNEGLLYWQPVQTSELLSTDFETAFDWLAITAGLHNCLLTGLPPGFTRITTKTWDRE